MNDITNSSNAPFLHHQVTEVEEDRPWQSPRAFTYLCSGTCKLCAVALWIHISSDGLMLAMEATSFIPTSIPTVHRDESDTSR
jgi:hypothetical protein